MSYSDRITRRAALLGALALAGCGFRPLYGTQGETEDAGALFGRITVEEIDGEIGFRLRQALIARLGPPREPVLTLTATQSAFRTALLVQQNDAITRYNLNLTVVWSLTRAGEELASGQSKTIAAVNAVASQYATTVSEREAYARAATDAADRIRRDIAAQYEPGWL